MHKAPLFPTARKVHYPLGLKLRGYRTVTAMCGLVLPWTRFAKVGEPVTCGNCRRLIPMSQKLPLTSKR